MVSEELIQRVYQEFDVRALPADEQDLYVDLDQVRGNVDAVPRLENTIRRANHGEWYGLNPMVAALKSPAKRKSTR